MGFRIDGPSAPVARRRLDSRCRQVQDMTAPTRVRRGLVLPVRYLAIQSQVMRTAKTGSVARRGSPRLASLLAREIELLATRHGRIVAFEVDEIDAIAEHLAELATSTSAPTVGLIDARELAELLGVARDWVYANADRLGGVRLGDGPRARLRFDADRAREALVARSGGVPPLSAASPRPRRGRPRRSAVAGVTLIQGRSTR